MNKPVLIWLFISYVKLNHFRNNKDVCKMAVPLQILTQLQEINIWIITLAYGTHVKEERKNK